MTYVTTTLFQKMRSSISHKSEDSSFFGYKTHIGMTKERIITAAVIGEEGNSPQVAALVEQSRKKWNRCSGRLSVIRLIPEKNNLEKIHDEHFELVVELNPSISQGFKKGR